MTFGGRRHSELAAYDLKTGLPAGQPLELPGAPAAGGGEVGLTFAFGAVWATGNQHVVRVNPNPCCTDITPAANAAPARPAVTAPTSVPAGRPGCSQFCLQAGPEGGPKTCASDCLPCPDEGCLGVLSRSAQVTGDLIPLQLQCLVTQPCSGALLLLPAAGPGTGPGGDSLPRSQWVAGSDFVVPPMSTATVYIELTGLGKRLVSSPGGYRGEVDVVLDRFGAIQLTFADRSLLVRR